MKKGKEDDGIFFGRRRKRKRSGCTNDGGKGGKIAREGGKDKCVPFYIFEAFVGNRREQHWWREG